MPGCLSLATRYCSMMEARPSAGDELASFSPAGSAGTVGRADFFGFVGAAGCGVFAAAGGSACSGGELAVAAVSSFRSGPRILNAIRRMCGYSLATGSLSGVEISTSTSHAVAMGSFPNFSASGLIACLAFSIGSV